MPSSITTRQSRDKSITRLDGLVIIALGNHKSRSSIYSLLFYFCNCKNVTERLEVQILLELYIFQNQIVRHFVVNSALDGRNQFPEVFWSPNLVALHKSNNEKLF